MAFRPLYFAPVVIFAALIGAVIIPKLSDQATEGNPALPSTRVGQEAPALTLTAFGQDPAPTAEDLRKPGLKLVNFWASWCQPCRVEHPMLERLKAEGITIHGINYKDKPEAAQGFLAEMGNPFAMIGADEGRTALDWGVYGVPETYVIDGTGKVVFRLAGPITEDNLMRQLRPAMDAAK